MGTPTSKRFIVLEGADLTGKTTIANFLAKSLNAELLRSPPPPFEKIKQSVLEETAPLARLYYFLASNIQISSMATEILATKSVVCDRYLWSTIAYHSAIESVPARDLVDFARPILRFLRMPDLVVFLQVNRQCQLSRAQNKVEDRLQRSLLLSDKFQLSLAEAYERTRDLVRAPWLVVDNSNLSVSETLAEIVARINNKL